MTFVLVALCLMAASGWLLYLNHRRSYRLNQEDLARTENENKKLQAAVKNRDFQLAKIDREHNQIQRWWDTVPEAARRKAVAEASQKQVIDAINKKQKERVNHDKS